jgi:phosphohistidine phosphatase SixA
VIVWIVRHGFAGSKADWLDDDAARPLTQAGRLQAQRVVPLLAGSDIHHLIASPTTRCIETLTPLSQTVGLPVRTSEHLLHEATPSDVFDLIARSGDGTVLCTHGEVMKPLLDDVRSRNIVVADRPRSQLLRKGTVWRLDLDAETLDVA